MTGNHDNLIGVMRRRCECCRAMLELAQHQQRLIHENRMSELLQVIAKKQRVLADLKSLGQNFGGLSAHWMSIRHTLSDEERAACDALLVKSESLLAQTLQQESHGTDILTQFRERIRGQHHEIDELLQTLPASNTGGATPEPQFLDASR